MFRNRHFDRVRETFADQFEPSDSGFVYRKNMKGAPIPVGSVERDAFIENFVRRVRLTSWITLGSIIIALSFLVILFPKVQNNDLEFVNYSYIILAVICVTSAIWYFRAWNAPSRALERRAAAGRARSKAELRQLMLEKTSYVHLAVVAVSPCLFLWRAYLQRELFEGWGLLWTALCVAALILIIVQATRKWLLGRRVKSSRRTL